MEKGDMQKGEVILKKGDSRDKRCFRKEGEWWDEGGEQEEMELLLKIFQLVFIEFFGRWTMEILKLKYHGHLKEFCVSGTNPFHKNADLYHIKVTCSWR